MSTLTRDADTSCMVFPHLSSLSHPFRRNPRNSRQASAARAARPCLDKRSAMAVEGIRTHSTATWCSNVRQEMVITCAMVHPHS